MGIVTVVNTRIVRTTGFDNDYGGDIQEAHDNRYGESWLNKKYNDLVCFYVHVVHKFGIILR